MYKVVGVREEKYIGKSISGHNCDFEYTDQEMTRHVILLKDTSGGNKVELTLSTEEGECGSGWCSAFYGQYEWKQVDTFAEKTHRLKDELILDISEGMLSTEEATYSNTIFSFTEYGGCCYYPAGGYQVDESKLLPV